MAKKKRRVNKSEAIRKYLAGNPDATPSEIIPALREKGIKVTPGLVSNVKSTSGPNRRRRKNSRKKKIVKMRRPGRRAATELSAVDLVAVKELADQLGGINEARRALDMLETLS